jgi:hypothetical protein
MPNIMWGSFRESVGDQRHHAPGSDRRHRGKETNHHGTNDPEEPRPVIVIERHPRWWVLGPEVGDCGPYREGVVSSRLAA